MTEDRGMTLPPGTKLMFTVTAVSEDLVDVIDAEGREWHLPREGGLLKAKAGDEFPAEILFRNPTPN